jgi:alcohol dehydrogenase
MQTVATVSSARKADYVKSLGADHVIDLSAEDLMERCFELFGRPRAIDHETHLPGHTATDPPGIDIVVNYVAGQTWHTAMRCTRAGGRILTCGALGGHLVNLDLRYVWSLQLQIRGATGWSIGEQEELVTLVAGGDLRPSIDSVHDFEDFGNAFERLTSSAALGKVLVRVADPA